MRGLLWQFTVIYVIAYLMVCTTNAQQCSSSDIYRISFNKSDLFSLNPYTQQASLPSNWKLSIGSFSMQEQSGDLSDLGSFNSMVNVSGGLFVAYYDSTSGTLKGFFCQDARNCSADSSHSTIDSTPDVGRFVSTTLGSDGLVIMSYYDQTIQALKIAHCEDVRCSSATVSYVVNAFSDVGRMSSITIGQDGFAIIASFDKTNNALMFSKCGNLVCSISSSKLLTPVGSNTGVWPSISVLSGKPIISFTNATSPSRLYVLACVDIYCTSNTIVGPLDSGFGAEFTSMTIVPSSNKLLIAFSGPSGLKLLTCTSASCTSPVISNIDVTVGAGRNVKLVQSSDGTKLFMSFGVGTIVKLVFCSEITCQQSTPLAYIIDSTITNQTTTSLAFSQQDGNLNVVYYGIDRTLKMAHCLNYTCATISKFTVADRSGKILTFSHGNNEIFSLDNRGQILDSSYLTAMEKALFPDFIYVRYLYWAWTMSTVNDIPDSDVVYVKQRSRIIANSWGFWGSTNPSQIQLSIAINDENQAIHWDPLRICYYSYANGAFYYPVSTMRISTVEPGRYRISTYAQASANTVLYGRGMSVSIIPVVAGDQDFGTTQPTLDMVTTGVANTPVTFASTTITVENPTRVFFYTSAALYASSGAYATLTVDNEDPLIVFATLKNGWFASIASWTGGTFYRTALLQPGTHTLKYNMYTYDASLAYSRGGGLYGFTLPPSAASSVELNCSIAGTPWTYTTTATVGTIACSIPVSVPVRSRMFSWVNGHVYIQSGYALQSGILIDNESAGDNYNMGRNLGINTFPTWAPLSQFRQAILEPGLHTIAFTAWSSPGSTGNINGAMLRVIYWPV